MKRVLTIFLIALLGVACSSNRPAVPPTPLADFTPELEVRFRWVVQLDKGVDSHYLRLTPLVVGEKVYGANRKGVVAAYHQQSSAHNAGHIWHRDLAREINAGPADGGELLLLGGNAEVLALNKSDGSDKWRSEVTSEVLSAPLLSGDRVIVKTLDGGVFALEAASGKQLWRYNRKVPSLSLRGSSRPVVINDVCLVGFADGQVAALDMHTGQPQWETTVTVPRGRTELERLVDVDASIIVVKGIVYVAGYQGRIAAMTLANGRLLWSRDISSYTGLAYANGALFVTDEEGNLWALSGRTGGPLWKQSDLLGRSPNAPVIQGHYVVVGDFEGYLHWFSQEDGHLAGRIRVEDFDALFPVKDDSYYSSIDFKEDRAVIGTPVVDGKHLFVMDKRGVLGAFEVTQKELD